MFVCVYHSYKSTTAQFPKQLPFVLHVQSGVLRHHIFVPPSIHKIQKHIITSKVFSPIIIIHYIINRPVLSVQQNAERQSPT